MFTLVHLALFTALLHYGAYLLYQSLRRALALRRFAQSHECKAPMAERPWDYVGVVKIYDMVRNLLQETALPNMMTLFHRYGSTYASRIMTQRVIFTCTPANIKQLLITRFDDYNNSEVRAHLFRPITEAGIFALDGPAWKRARHLYRDVFLKTREIFDLDLQEACHVQFREELERALAVSGGTVDLAPMFLKLMYDATTAFGLGESAETLRGPDQPADKKMFTDSLIYAKKIIARDGFLGPVRVFLSRKEFHRSCKEVHRYTEKIIHRALARRRNQAAMEKTPSRIGGGSRTAVDAGLSHPACETAGPTPFQANNLLEHLLDHSDDVVALRDGVITILIAGIDSVGSLLSTTFFLLARHQTVYQKLRASILDEVGTEKPTYNQLKALSYLRCVFYEAMRVYPPVPFNARIANRDTWLPSGGGADGQSSVLIQKGTRVIFSAWASHRSFDNFGEDAHDFVPERWEHLKAESSLGYFPFNLGPRACLGQQYALLEASYHAVRIVQSFSQVYNRDPLPWKEKIGLNLSNKNGVVVELVR